ncbi:MAG: proton-conducting transporter membrane subunit [Chthoniobacteraceae bacterium]|nr:proton-conducting transporter membrane subunit [Chthoniobacteraceae bacterium]
MIDLFVFSLLLSAVAMVLPAVVRDARRLNPAVHLLNAFALGLGLVFSVSALLGNPSWEASLTLPFAGAVRVGFDGLTLFFLFTFQLLSLAASVYAIGYLKAYIAHGVGIRAHLSFFTLLMLSMQLLLVARNALLFLILWECMAVSAYFCIVLEKEKPEVRRGGFWYLMATHASVLLLYVFFVVLRETTGSWDFGAWARFAGWNPGLLAILFTTGFLGFAIKAGFMPFHAWLPNAHPAAPAHVSSLLSAINIKAGIYGIARMLLILPAENAAAFGWVLLAVSVVSAIGGVWYALAQHDIKKLLAYHSVENIGIIGIGLAVGWLGRCAGLPGLAALGFAGALLHTLNHALFKGLLFFGAGNVALYARTGNIEKMGGLMRALPITGIGFLIGAVSICGLPPFNGFISEFLIYKSLFQGGLSMFQDDRYAPLILLVSAVGLAFMGGLAVACFTKLYGVVFLGENRSGEAVRPDGEKASSFPVLLGLAALCAWIGLVPGSALKLLLPALGEMCGTSNAPLDAVTSLGGFTSVFGLLLGMVLLTLLVRALAQRKYGVRVRETWCCGYDRVTARMQYTASSFAEELVKLGRPMLGLKLAWKPLQRIAPEPRSFESHGYDQMEEGLWLNLNRAIGRALTLLRWIQSGNIRHYVLYVFVALIVYLAAAFLW